VYRCDIDAIRGEPLVEGEDDLEEEVERGRVMVREAETQHTIVEFGVVIRTLCEVPDAIPVAVVLLQKSRHCVDVVAPVLLLPFP
jgi:hypothetical protein